MNEFDNPAPVSSETSPGLTPGALLRQAREASGLHIVVLAAALKVPVRKLEALESNRWDELTDATFARALASSIARHLKIDVHPILQGLPAARPNALSSPSGLGSLSQGATVSLGSLDTSRAWGKNSLWILVLLFASAGLYFSPQVQQIWIDEMPPVTAGAVPAETASENGAEIGAASPQPVVEAVTPSSEVQVVPSAASLPSTAQSVPLVSATVPSAPVLVLVASDNAWVEVIDVRGQVRIQRVLKQGEEISFGEGAPFAVVLGNVAGAKVTVRGQLLDLANMAKNNVARFEVK